MTKNQKPAAKTAKKATKPAKAVAKAKPTANAAKPAASANETAATATAAAKPAKDAATPAAGVDGFGLRVGSKASAFCSHLTKQPQTMRQLMEAAGATRTFFNTLNKLAAQGKLVKGPDGYSLPAKTK